jgi:hypothetical protein
MSSFFFYNNSIALVRSELYRVNYLRLSTKLVATFADRGCRMVSLTDPYVCILASLDRSPTISSKKHLSCTYEAEWTPFQAHYFSENVVAPGIEPGPPDL